MGKKIRRGEKKIKRPKGSKKADGSEMERSKKRRSRPKKLGEPVRRPSKRRPPKRSRRDDAPVIPPIREEGASEDYRDYGRGSAPAENDFEEPDSLYHEPTTTYQDYSDASVEAPREETPPVNGLNEDMLLKIERKIGPHLEESLQNYFDRYFYAELDRRFKEVMECVVKQEAVPSQPMDATALEEIKRRLDQIEDTQQRLLQHQMEMELEMVCNKCGHTIPEDSETCTFCSKGPEDEDFVADDRDYRRQSSREPMVEDDFMDFSNIERIPVQERKRTVEWDEEDSYNNNENVEDWGGNDYGDYDPKGEYGGVTDNYDPTPGARRRQPSSRGGYDPTPQPNYDQEPQTPQGPPPQCPNCYRPLEYVNQYDAYFCRNCMGYLDMATRKLVKIGPSGENKKRSSKRYQESAQKLEDVVTYLEYDPDKDPKKGQGGQRGKKKKGLFGFGKK